MKLSEEWKVFRDGYYHISDLGNVKRTHLGKSNIHGMLLVPSFDKDGYPEVNLSIPGIDGKRKIKTFKIHVLVAEVFIGPRPNGQVINHKDGVKTNNSISNLEYCTIKENCIHAINSGLYVPPCGEKHPNSKLTELQIRQIRRDTKKSFAKIAKLFNCSPTTIGSIVNKQQWKHVV